MKLKKLFNPELLFAGVILLAGITIISISSSYSIGTISRMGPGYFPLMIGIVVILLAVLLMFFSGTANNAIKFPYKPFFAVAAGVLSFIFLLELFGMIPAIFSLVMLCSLADPNLKFRSAVIISIVMAAVGVLLFVKLLSVPAPILKW